MCLLGGGETRRIYREASIPGTVTLYQSEGEEERRMANTADLGAGGRGSRHYKWPWDRGRFVRHQNAPLDVERVSTTKATFFFCQFAHALVRFSLGNRVTAPPCHVTSRLSWISGPLTRPSSPTKRSVVAGRPCPLLTLPADIHALGGHSRSHRAHPPIQWYSSPIWHRLSCRDVIP